MENINRRSFVSGAALSAAALVAAPMAARADEAARTWDKEADVVVVGAGGTGLAAAAQAATDGASVLVLEKSDMIGGNTGLSGGLILAAGTKVQADLGIDDDVERFAEEQIALGMGAVDEDLVRRMCVESPEIVEWLQGMGKEYNIVNGVPSLKPYSNDENWAPRCHWHQHADNPYQSAGLGMEHTEALRTTAEAGGAVIETGVEVTKLITDGENGVIGVEAVTVDGQPIAVRANKGVILATAGVDNNIELARKLNKLQYWALQQIEKGCGYLFEMATNTGDGIRMGMEIGADVVTSEACVMISSPLYPGAVQDFHVVDYPDAAPNLYQSSPLPGTIFVNEHGNRFFQEDAMWGYATGKIYQEVRDNGHIDEPLSAAKIYGLVDGGNLEYWLACDKLGTDASVDDMVASGRLLKDDTLEGLAEQMGVNVENLVATVERWNGFVADGEDRDFGRVADMAPIAEGPFYAANMNSLVIMGTTGGLKINADCQVIDVNGNVIPRLYAGGQNAGGWMGQYYHSCGWSVLGTAVHGRNAGRHAASLESWA